MKKFIKSKCCVLLVITTLLGCTSEDSKEETPVNNVKETFEIKTLEVIDITESTAVIKANLISLGDTKAAIMGICISALPNPTIDSGKDVLTAAIGNFESKFSDLSPRTKYYARSYVTANSKTLYGNEISFTTSNGAEPKVTTAYIANITTTSATIGGTFENIKKLIVTSSGVCISTNPNPTILDAQKNLLLDEDYTNKKFIVNLGKLTPATKYYARAYIETVFGIYYGEIISFATKDLGLPFVETNGVRGLSLTKVNVGGILLNDGGSVIIKYGICLSNLHQNPNLDTDYTTVTTTTGIPNTYFYNDVINHYSPGAFYYARAYATNKYGTSYGAVVKFNLN